MNFLLMYIVFVSELFLFYVIVVFELIILKFEGDSILRWYVVYVFYIRFLLLIVDDEMICSIEKNVKIYGMVYYIDDCLYVDCYLF